MDEITQEFLAESREGLDAFDRHMVALEGDPDNLELLTSIFRIVHTIKGTCGFLGFTHLEALTHTGENLLARLRERTVKATPAVATALLALGDGIRTILNHIDLDGAEGEPDHAALLATLAALVSEARAVPTPPAQVVPDARPALAAPAAPEAPAAQETPAAQAAPAGPASVVRPAAETDAGPGPPVEGASLDAPRDAPRTESSVRVDVGVLDKLMNLVGEMVLTRNQIAQLTTNAADPVLAQACQRLNLLTTELQEGVMKTRMQPIGQVWNRFPRLVRDVSLTCTKQVRLEMTGKDTELDRTVLEAIRDPLVHILRNAIDHGIETPDVRRANGKPSEGTLRLSAWHEGGLVHVEIEDDGAGIDTARILAKARERGLVHPDAALTERDIVNLIFHPGLSTANQVTAISGRGVGMDVVKSNVERIGGTVEIRSVPGAGSRFRISIPLTLAIIPVLIVASHANRYAIPQVNLVELVRVDPAAAPGGIERVEGCRVHRLRGHLLPVIDLGETLGEGPDTTAGRVNLVVVQAGGHRFGIRVGTVFDTEEIVVKATDRYLQGLPCYAGVTILGDGAVALILDVAGLARLAALRFSGEEARVAANDTHAFGSSFHDDVLLLGIGGDRRVAIRLGDVARIEEIRPDALEIADGRPVIQYRGEILSIVSLCERFGDGAAPTGERVPVVVHRRGDLAVGFLAERILDVVADVPAPAPNRRARHGIRGSVVVRDRVTDLVDVDALAAEVQAAYTPAGAVA